MTKDKHPVALVAKDSPLRSRPTVYPEPYASRVAKREKRPLGELFGLSNFGVNLTRLPTGAQSALRHRHSHQDEFVYILEGQATLVTDAGETLLRPGMCAGFKAGSEAHHLINHGKADVVYLEMGDRSTGDAVFYPDDDIQAVLGEDGRWKVSRKDGSSF